MKKILVLTGSPRVNGNSDLMAEAFIKGASTAGHEIMRFNAGRKNIKGCRACNTCFGKGKACSYEDDFEEVAPMLLKADALVLATPLYYYSFPSELKAVIDKMYSLYFAKQAKNIKESLLLVCAETSVETDFDGIIKSYELIAAFEQWVNRGHMIVPSVNEIGDMRKTGALEKIELLGKSF